MAVQFWVHPSGNIFHLEHKKKFFCLKTSCLSLHYTILYVIYRAVALLTFLIWLMMGQLWSICDHYELLFMCTGIERQITAGRCLCFPPVLICDWSKWWKYKCWEKYAKEILKYTNLWILTMQFESSTNIGWILRWCLWDIFNFNTIGNILSMH